MYGLFRPLLCYDVYCYLTGVWEGGALVAERDPSLGRLPVVCRHSQS